MSLSNFKFIDLFAGIGGFRIPFEALGGECVFSSEWDKHAQITYEKNFGEKPRGDITKIHSSEVPDHDILLGGFPCQAFSNAGKKLGFEDTRGTLFFEIQRILSDKRPKVFLLENVKRLKTHKGKDGRSTFGIMLDILEGRTSIDGIDRAKDLNISEEARKTLSKPLNYSVDYKVLSPADFGIPQNRERVFIVGFDRDSFLPKGIELSDILKWPTKWKGETRVGSILEHSLSARELRKYTISERLWKSHQARKKRNKEMGRGFGYSLYYPEDLKTGTMSARYYKDGAEILISNGKKRNGEEKPPRKLTPRESARLQGFPESFKLSDSNNEAYKQFGNAVNVRVVRLIAEKIITVMNEIENLKSYSKTGKIVSANNQMKLDI